MATDQTKSDLIQHYRLLSKKIRENNKEPDPALYFHRGMICLSLRDNCANPGSLYTLTGDAIADFNEAIRLDPKYANAHFWRGRAWYFLGEKHKWRYDYDEAMRLDPLFTDRIE